MYPGTSCQADGPASDSFFADLTTIEAGAPVERIKHVKTDIVSIGASSAHDFSAHVTTCELPPTNIRINNQKLVCRMPISEFVCYWAQLAKEFMV